MRKESEQGKGKRRGGVGGGFGGGEVEGGKGEVADDELRQLKNNIESPLAVGIANEINL